MMRTVSFYTLNNVLSLSSRRFVRCCGFLVNSFYSADAVPLPNAFLRLGSLLVPKCGLFISAMQSPRRHFLSHVTLRVALHTFSRTAECRKCRHHFYSTYFRRASMLRLISMISFYFHFGTGSKRLPLSYDYWSTHMQGCWPLVSFLCFLIFFAPLFRSAVSKPASELTGPRKTLSAHMSIGG